MNVPNPPRGLGPAGIALWAAVVSAFELAPHELTILHVASSQQDMNTDLERLIGEVGLLVTGASGQPRLNGAVGELRQGRLAVVKMLGELGISADDAGVALPSPASQRARKAANARWDRVRRVEGRRLATADG